MKEAMNQSHQPAAGFPAEFGINSDEFKGKGYHRYRYRNRYIHTGQMREQSI